MRRFISLLFVFVFAALQSNEAAGIQVKPRRGNYTESAYGLNLKMIYVKGGEFLMGEPAGEGDEARAEKAAVHKVKVDDYYIGQFEITQSQWRAVMGTDISRQKHLAGAAAYYGVGGNYPMYYITWEEAVEFCNRLSRRTGKKYSLPTEAEWEYAARGGQAGETTRYAGSDDLKRVAWYFENSPSATHPVGSKKPNKLGLYDMSGNVWEWCQDWYGDTYDESDTDNPAGPASGTFRVSRGGGSGSEESDCRVYRRSGNHPGFRLSANGFRVVCRP